jgi:hypothetical protein
MTADIQVREVVPGAIDPVTESKRYRLIHAVEHRDV